METKGKVVTSITRIGKEEIDPLGLLHCLYLYSEMTHGHNFTVSDFYENNNIEGVGPAIIYGIAKNDLMKYLENLARDYDGYIRVNFNKGIMEDIYLNNEKSLHHVIDLFKERV